MIRLPSRRTIIVTLTALFVISVIVVSVGWFIGAIPTYPHISEWEVCTYPEIVSSKLYGIERKELFVAICFSTSDSWEQVAAWYEPFGWTGQNIPTDEYGMIITRKFSFDHLTEITVKRFVTFSLYEPLDVRVVSAYEIRSDLFSKP